MDCLPVHIFAPLKWFLSNQPKNIAIIAFLLKSIAIIEEKTIFCDDIIKLKTLVKTYCSIQIVALRIFLMFILGRESTKFIDETRFTNS